MRRARRDRPPRTRRRNACASASCSAGCRGARSPVADVPPRLRRELAAGVRRAPHRLGDLGERHPNTSCSTNATRSAGVSDSSTTSSAVLTESSSVTARAGRRPTDAAKADVARQRLGQPLAHVALAPRPCGAEHVEADATRDAHEPRTGIVDRVALGVARRYQRTYVSCTASSASATVPSMRIREPHQLGALLEELASARSTPVAHDPLGLELGHAASSRPLHCTTTQRPECES